MYTVFSKFFDYLRYRSAVKKADKAHKKTGERYYVMPSTGYDRKLIIMDRYNFRKLKQKGYINRNANQRDLLRECFYCTPYVNGNGYLDSRGRRMKIALYFSWCKAQRVLKKANKNEKRK
jgi:hypothetical protein